MEYILPTLLWAAVIGAIIYVLAIKKGRNRKAAQSGEDKARVKQAAEQVLGKAKGCKLVYAHREERESYGRTVRTTFYRYAVAFQNQVLLIIPLGIDKKTREIQAGAPVALNAEHLGKVTVKTKEKEGAIRQVDVWLADKQGRTIIQLVVDAENLRKNRWYPVNILQEEECEAFEHFITPLAHRVAQENPEVDAKIAAEANEGFGTIGVILSVIGVLGGLGFPPVGAGLCALGLVLALVGKLRGAKGKVGLIITIICMILMGACSLPYFMALLA